MLAAERRNEIVSLINEKKSVLVQELSRKYEVTEETIRRDLEKLEKQGLLVRTYGGAVLTDDARVEMPLDVRAGINIPGKDAIGRRAAEMVEDGETIILDASTSALYVAKHLKAKKDLTVITNAMKVILELAGCENIKVISTGGVLRGESMSCVGSTAEKALAGYTANKLFFSCKGFTLHRGLTDSNEQEADVRKLMLKCAEKRVFLCDRTKVGRTGFVNTAGMKDIDCVVTDACFPEGWEEPILGMGISLIMAEIENDKEA